MKLQHRIILLTVIFGLLIWAVCVTLAIVVSPQMTSQINQSLLIAAISALITIFVSLFIGTIMSRMAEQRLKTMRALEETEERFHVLSEAAFEGILIHDGTKIIEINDAGTKMPGYKTADLLGKPARDFIAPESVESVMNNFSLPVTEEEIN